MRKLLVAVSLLLSTTASYAERPSTLTMSCQQAQSLVAKRGAVVMSTGRHTYDRFVASWSFCMLGEYAYNAWAPTRDTLRCPLGYTCQPNPPLWDDDNSYGGSFFRR